MIFYRNNMHTDVRPRKQSCKAHCASRNLVCFQSNMSMAGQQKSSEILPCMQCVSEPGNPLHQMCAYRNILVYDLDIIYLSGAPSYPPPPPPTHRARPSGRQGKEAMHVQKMSLGTSALILPTRLWGKIFDACHAPTSWICHFKTSMQILVLCCSSSCACRINGHHAGLHSCYYLSLALSLHTAYTKTFNSSSFLPQGHSASHWHFVRPWCYIAFNRQHSEA